MMRIERNSEDMRDLNVVLALPRRSFMKEKSIVHDINLRTLILLRLCLSVEMS